MQTSTLALGEAGALWTIAIAAAIVALIHFLTWRASRFLLRAAQAGAKRLRGAQTWRDYPLRAWMQARFPHLYAVAAARLDTRRFTGLPLTLIAAAALYLAFLFAGLIEEVLEAEEIEATDKALLDLIAPFRHARLVTLFRWITELGAMPTLTAVAIVATGLLWARGPQAFIFPVWLTVLGSQLTTWSGKFILARARPEFVLDVTAYSPSFPSGHATGAAAVYGIIAYAILRDLPGPRARYEVAFWTLLLIALIAFSRVFLGVHYPSDVAAGLLVGGFWLLAGVALAEATRTTAK